MLLILTGKTASGKDTIKARLLEKYPNFKKVVTTTSRLPRPGESNGVDYYFLTRQEFEEKVAQEEFAEYVEYGGNLYGTFKKELEQALNEDILWRIDPSRAGEARDFIKRAFPEDIVLELIKRVVVVYINAPDDIILERLQKRGLAQEEIDKRMADDKWIWEKYQNSYDFVVENVENELGSTLDKITKIIENPNLD